MSVAPDSGRDVSRAHIWRMAVGVAMAGTVLTIFLASWLWERAQTEAEELLAEQGQMVAESVLDALDEVVEQLSALGSFYQASEQVTQDEFRRFIANFDVIPGMGGLGYLPLVTAEELAAFEQDMAGTIPGYQVWEMGEDGKRVPVGDRPLYVPIQWFEPAEAFGRPHGFDVASEPARRSAVIRARVDKEPALTTFLPLVGDDDPDGFLILFPVITPETGEVMGLTAAPMDLGELLDGQVPASNNEELSWSIEVRADGRRPGAPPEDSWTTVIDVGNQWWGLTATRIDRPGIQLTRGEMVAGLVVLAGLITSLLSGLGLYLARRKTETQKELDQLRELTRAKDQFLATVSHELRTPLTGVLGFAELLREPGSDLTESDRRAMLANIAEEASDLSAIIDDLLVAARSELDLLAITRVAVSLRAQVAQVLETTDERARRNIEVVGEEGNRYPALGDPGRVRQVVRNLVTNALRYGGDHIEVRLLGGEHTVGLEVADDGDGLPPDEWERIFEPYYRAHRNETQPSGIGIGLSVARHLARLMGGDLSYQREEGWSVFRLSLPALTVQEPHELEAAPMTALQKR